MIREIISYTHYTLLFYFISFPYITPIQYLKYVLTFWYATVYHWYLLNGRCWMSILEDKFKNENEPKTNVVNNLNIPKFIFDLIVHINFFIAFYRLQFILGWFVFFFKTISLNKLIYKTYCFK